MIMTIDRKQLVPPYIRNLETYQSGKPIEELAKEKGLKKISKLASNENPLGPSPKALQSIRNSIDNTHRYPDMHARVLTDLLAARFKLKPENIVFGNGSEGIMSCIVRAFLGVDEEVLTSEGSFVGFYILAKGVGAKIKTVSLTEDYQYDIEKIANSITSKTKIIYIANPNNPTGRFITKAQFDFLMSKVPEHVLVLLDEAYFEFAIGTKDYPDSMDYRYDNVITLRTFSKAYGLAGIRIGYGFAHEDLITNIKKVKLPFEPNSLALAAGVGALEDTEHLRLTLENNKKEILKLSDFFNKKNVQYIPSSTNFLTFKTGSLENTKNLYELFLNEGVILRPLIKNDLPNFIRISIGTESEMNHFKQAFERIWPRFFKQKGI